MLLGLSHVELLYQCGNVAKRIQSRCFLFYPLTIIVAMQLADAINIHLQGAREWIQESLVLYTSSSLFTRKNIAVAAISSGVGYAVVKCIIYRLYFHPLVNIPGPPIDWIPFLGNLRESYLAEVLTKMAQTLASIIINRSAMMKFSPVSWRRNGPKNTVALSAYMDLGITP